MTRVLAEERWACLACGTDAPIRVRAPDVNRGITDEVFSYAVCPRCGLWFLTEVPEDLGPFYADKYYSSPTREEIARVALRERYQIELLLKHLRPPGRLVEIGAAWGVFAWQAREAGFDVHAVEMDEACCRQLRDVVGVTATQSSTPESVLPELPTSDAVVMWQVLEHLLNPVAVLDAAVANLRPGGLLLVATPNPGSLGMRRMGARWPHLDAPRHVTLVPAELMRTWMRERGMAEVAMVDTDLGARRWNRFAWQRLLLNRIRARVALLPLLAAGAALSALAFPWETRPGNGSSYTAIFAKATA